MNYQKPKFVVVGIGQTMRGDDGIGVAAVQAWQAQYPQTATHPDVRVEIVELPGLDLLELLSGVDAVLIVDAVKSGDHPGKIHLLDEQALSAFNPGAGSAHGWGVVETIRLGRKLDSVDSPGTIKIIGITAKQFGIGRSLSPEIIENLPIIVGEIENQVQTILQEEDW